MNIEIAIDGKPVLFRILRRVDNELSAISYEDAKKLARREYGRLPTIKEFIKAQNPKTKHGEALYEATKDKAYWLEGNIHLSNAKEISKTAYLKLDYATGHIYMA